MRALGPALALALTIIALVVLVMLTARVISRARTRRG